PVTSATTTSTRSSSAASSTSAMTTNGHSPSGRPAATATPPPSSWTAASQATQSGTRHRLHPLPRRHQRPHALTPRTHQGLTRRCTRSPTWAPGPLSSWTSAEACLCVPKTSSTSCDQAIFADQATDASVSSDAVLTEIDRFGQRLQRRGAVQGAVRPMLVVVDLVVAQDPPQMVLVPDQGAVQELAAASPNPAFGDPVH